MNLGRPYLKYDQRSAFSFNPLIFFAFPTATTTASRRLDVVRISAVAFQCNNKYRRSFACNYPAAGYVDGCKVY
jgi:hypothetical protein